MHRDQFTGNPRHLFPRKEGMQASSLGGAKSPMPKMHSKPRLQTCPGKALLIPLTSSTFLKAQRGKGKVRRNSIALLPRLAPSSSLLSPAVQTLFCLPGVNVSLTPPSPTLLSPDMRLYIRFLRYVLAQSDYRSAGADPQSPEV